MTALQPATNGTERVAGGAFADERGGQIQALPLATRFGISAAAAPRIPQRQKSVAVVVGTRPELIKLHEVLRLLGRAAMVIHTGQHFDADLWADVHRDLDLDAPDHILDIGGRPRAAQIGLALNDLGDLFRELTPEVVVVHGDTNAAVAGALAANAEGVPLVHVEAGLRSHDRRMPEEHNRVMVDHLADLCLAPTATAHRNLVAEQIDSARVVVTGNTIVEVVQRLVPPAQWRRKICAEQGVRPGQFVVATLHRPENSDDTSRLAAILEDLRSLPVPVVLPLHPRTRQAAPSASLDGIRVTGPLPPRVFMSLLAECALAVSDSGGVQEEVTVLGGQALIVRRSTERPEAVGVWCDLVEPGLDFRQRAQARLARLDDERRRETPSPFGDGTASQRVVDAIGSFASISLEKAS